MLLKRTCLESDLNLENEEFLMLWGIEFQVLTPWYKKDCCSFVVFINRIVNMREEEQRVGRECLTLDLRSIGLGYTDVVYGINYTLFYQLRKGKVCSVSRPLDWYMKSLHWNFILFG